MLKFFASNFPKLLMLIIWPFCVNALFSQNTCIVLKSSWHTNLRRDVRPLIFLQRPNKHLCDQYVPLQTYIWYTSLYSTTSYCCTKTVISKVTINISLFTNSLDSLFKCIVANQNDSKPHYMKYMWAKIVYSDIMEGVYTNYVFIIYWHCVCLHALSYTYLCQEVYNLFCG